MTLVNVAESEIDTSSLALIQKNLSNVPHFSLPEKVASVASEVNNCVFVSNVVMEFDGRNYNYLFSSCKIQKNI